MITLEESEFLLQIVGSVKEQCRNLEAAYMRGDYERMAKIKDFIFKVQGRVNEILERTKR